MSLLLNKLRLFAAEWFQADDLPALVCEDAALSGALQVAFLNQERFVNFFEGVGLFADSDGDGAKPDGAALVVFSHYTHDLFVHFIEAALVNLKEFECGGSDPLGDDAVATLLCLVAAEVDQIIRDTWGAARAAGDFGCAIALKFYF